MDIALYNICASNETLIYLCGNNNIEHWLFSKDDNLLGRIT
jgi:hypothetical protein